MMECRILTVLVEEQDIATREVDTVRCAQAGHCRRWLEDVFPSTGGETVRKYSQPAPTTMTFSGIVVSSVYRGSEEKMMQCWAEGAKAK